MSVDHDRTFVRTFLAVLGVLVGITFLIIYAARLIMATTEPDEPSAAQRERIEARTQPAFEAVTDPDQLAATERAPEQPEEAPTLQSGEVVYERVCAACHAAGVAGAPITGEAEAWESRLAKGKETLYRNAINGLNAMPPKGGDPSLADEEVQRAVDYMLEQTGG